MINLPSTPATRVGVNVLILLGSVVAMRLGESVLVPLTTALLLAAVLGPAALWMHQRLRFSWTGSCLFAVLGLVLFNLLVTGVFAISLSRMLSVLPRAPERPAAGARHERCERSHRRVIEPEGHLPGIEAATCAARRELAAARTRAFPGARRGA